MKYDLLHILLVFAFSVSTAFSQEASEVRLQLSFADGKSVFKTGETVPVKLAFTAEKGGYIVNTHVDWADTTQDDVIISPDTGVNHWKSEHMRGAAYATDVASIAKLSGEPVIVEMPLTDFFRFDNPGKYSIKFVTRRVSFGSFGDIAYKPITVTSNPIEFEIVPMTEDEEQEIVNRLSREFEAAGGWQEQTKIAERLADLTGDASAREKVSLFLSPKAASSGNIYGALRKGLFKSRNRPLVISLLEAAFRDVNREVNHSLIHTLTELRFKSTPPETGSVDPKPRNFFSAPDPEYQRIKQAYIDELIESLPSRTAKSLTTTSIAILQNVPRENPQAEPLKKVRAILLKEFDNLHILDREYLLRAFWKELRDPSLTPAIEKMLNDNSYDPMYRMNVRGTTIERLIEVDKSRARPHVINELRDSQSLIDVEVLGKLDDKFLPAADDALFEQIRGLSGTDQPVFLRAKTLRAARFSTAKHYLALLDIYKLYADKWWADSRGALLGYLARHNDKEAVPLIEKELERTERGHEFNLLIGLTRVSYSDGMNKILLRQLNGGDPETAGTAAYLITKHGDKAGAEAVRARLKEWVNEWKDRRADLDSPAADQPLSSQAMFQINMIVSLLNAKSLKLTESQKSEIKQSCLTVKCREHFRLR